MAGNLIDRHVGPKAQPEFIHIKLPSKRESMANAGKQLSENMAACAAYSIHVSPSLVDT